MKLYRVSFNRLSDDQHTGYAFHASERSALQDGKQASTEHSFAVTPIEVEPTKDGVLKVLNQYAGHPDNG